MDHAEKVRLLATKTSSKFTYEQAEVMFELVFHPKHIEIVQGIAGCGKSYILRSLLEYLGNYPDAVHLEEECVGCTKKIGLCAPTGIAAINIDGHTVDRLLGGYRHVRESRQVLGDYGKTPMKDDQRTNVLYAFDTIKEMIDERPQQFSCLIVDEAYMVNFVNLVYLLTSLPPCGRIFFFGDPYQFPPVASLRFTLHHLSIAKKWQVYEMNCIVRTQDVPFQKYQLWLRECVKNKTNFSNLNASSLEFLEYFSTKNNIAVFSQLPDPKTYVCSTNGGCSMRNKKYLDSLPGELYTFPMSCNDPVFQKTQEKVDFNSTYRFCPVLKIKLGATVICTRNMLNDPEINYSQYVNGTIGIVKSVNENQIVITDGSKEYLVYRITFRLLKETRVSQFPLVLGKSVTAHRLQGMTIRHPLCIENVKTINMVALYVITSRVTSPNLLYFASPFSKFSKLFKKNKQVSDECIIEKFF